MNIKSGFFTVLATLLFLTSCGGNPTVMNAIGTLNRNAQKEGCPYRYKAAGDGNAMIRYIPDALKNQIDSAPAAPTIADAVLKKDILNAIGSAEVQNGGNGTPKLLETRTLDKINTYYREAWVIDRNGKSIVYVVTFKIVAAGGTDYKIYPLENIHSESSAI